MPTDHAIQRGAPEQVVASDGGAPPCLLNIHAGVVRRSRYSTVDPPQKKSLKPAAQAECDGYLLLRRLDGDYVSLLHTRQRCAARRGGAAERLLDPPAYLPLVLT